MSREPIEIFISYAPKDEALKDELLSHLAPLRREGYIDAWYDTRIPPGADRKVEIRNRIDAATVFLILLSPDYLASDYLHDVELKRAIDRQKEGIAKILPILLRPVDSPQTTVAALDALPTNHRAVTTWKDRDMAWKEVVCGLRATLGICQHSTRPVKRSRNSKLLSLKIILSKTRRNVTVVAVSLSVLGVQFYISFSATPPPSTVDDATTLGGMLNMPEPVPLPTASDLSADADTDASADGGADDSETIDGGHP